MNFVEYRLLEFKRTGVAVIDKSGIERISKQEIDTTEVIFRLRHHNLHRRGVPNIHLDSEGITYL